MSRAKFMQALLIITLTVGLGAMSFGATGGMFDAYKQTFGETQCHTKVSDFLEAASAQFNSLTMGKLIQVDLGADGLKPNSLASSSYGGGVTTVDLNVSNLTSNLTAVYVAASRDGTWPNGPGYVAAADYGTGRAALKAADMVAAAAGKMLLIGPGTWTIKHQTL